MVHVHFLYNKYKSINMLMPTMQHWARMNNTGHSKRWMNYENIGRSSKACFKNLTQRTSLMTNPTFISQSQKLPYSSVTLKVKWMVCKGLSELLKRPQSGGQLQDFKDRNCSCSDVKTIVYNHGESKMLISPYKDCANPFTLLLLESCSSCYAIFRNIIDKIKARTTKG